MIDTKILSQKKCVPCEGGAKPFSVEDAKVYASALDGWKLSDDGKKISKQYAFKDFIKSIDFVNQIADVAEMEGHHPDITINYNKVTCELSTHAILGLSENDFIVAAKIDELWLN